MSKKHKEKDPDIIEMIGGEKRIKEWGKGLEAYVDLFSRTIILPEMSPEECEKTTEKVLEMIKDMKKGKTYMFDKDAVEEMYDKMDANFDMR